MRHRVRWFLAGILLAAASAAPAGLYKWVDDQGNLHFADRPPDVAPSSGVQGPKRPTVREALEAERQRQEAEREAERKKAQAAALEAERKAQAAAAAARPPEETVKKCKQARRNVAMHTNVQRDMYAPKADGTMELLTPAEVDGLREGWQAVVDRVCK